MPFFGRDPAIKFEYRAGMDIALLGGTFTRGDATQCATQMDTHGIFRTVPANVLRDRHSVVVGAPPRALIEMSRQNLALNSSNFVDAGSWNGGSSFVLAAAPSIIAGQTAYRHTDDGGGNRARSQNVGTFAGGGQSDCAWCIVENVNAVRCEVSLFDGTASAHVHYGRLTFATESFSTILGAGNGGVIKLGGGRYLLWVTGVGATAGNTRRILIYASGATVNTDTVILHHGQIEPNALFPSSPIITAGTALTRAQDQLVFPVAFNPHELTLYGDGIDVGAGRQATNSFAITNMATLGRNGPGDYDLSLRLNANGADRRAQVRVGNAGGSPTQAIGDITSGTFLYGDRMEIAARLYAIGKVDAQQSINGAATVSGALSVDTVPMESTWGLGTVEVGHFGTSVGGWAIASVKIVSGARTLTEMRAFTTSGRAAGARPRLVTPPRFPGHLESLGQSGKGQHRAVMAMGRTWEEVYPLLDGSNPNVRALIQQINKALREGTLWDVQHPYWQKRKGAGGGLPQVNGANQSGSVLVVDGAPLTQFNWLRAGDIIKVPGCPVIFDVTEDVTTNASGQASIPIHPPIFVGQSPADNAYVAIEPDSIFFKAFIVGASEFPPMDVTEHMEPGLTLTWREQPQ